MLNVFIGNLGKYNEGELVGTWLSLPASEKQIQDAFVRIGVGRYTEKGFEFGVEEDGCFYEEYEIFDWEMDFSSHQRFSHWGVYTLNEFAKKLKELEMDRVFVLYQQALRGKIDIQKVIEEVVYVMNELDLEHDFLHDDQVVEEILFEAKRGSWERIKFFLEDADVNQEWHVLDGYGNLRPVRIKDVEFAIQRILDYVEEELHHLVVSA
ncbi:UNVERIFIED_ORG: antirestriction protein ArdA [Anoxybacillus amylolyticus]